MKAIAGDFGSLAAPLLNDEYQTLASWAINHSQESILISTFLLNLNPQQDHQLRVRKLVRAISDAAWRGVRVQVILGNPTGPLQLRSNLVAACYFQRRGMEVRILKSMSHHLKFMLIDSSMYFVGSHNWTPSALEANFEASILLRDTATAKEMSSLFHELWNQSEHCEDICRE